MQLSPIARSAVAAGAFLLVGAGNGTAQVPAGTEFLVNSHTTGSQRRPAVGVDGRGNFVIAWRSYGRDGSSYGIAARRFTAAGAPLGPEFVVNTHTTGGQTEPAVGVARDGSFVVAWQSAHETGDFDIFARRFDAGGAPRGGEFRVNVYTTSVQINPAVAADGRGRFVVSWMSNGQDGSGFGIFGRRYDVEGTPPGQEFLVNTRVTAGQQMSPSVAANADGAFVIAWHGDSGAGHSDVFLHSYMPDGSSWVEGEASTSWMGGQITPAVAMDALGRIVMAWNTDQGGPPGSPAGEIRARTFGAYGFPGLGGDFLVNTYTTDGQADPSVAMDDLGNFVIVWGSAGQDGDFSGVFGQRFAWDGPGQTRRGSEFRVNTTTAGHQSPYWHAVGSDPVGNFVVSWSGLGDGGGYGVFAQRFGGLVPESIALDGSPGPTSDGNGVFEPDETVSVAPFWRNVSGGTLSFGGQGLYMSGPTGTVPAPAYDVVDPAAAYGVTPDGSLGDCRPGGDCYSLRVLAPGGRPRPHWDATFVESILPDTLGQTKRWSVHLGDTFADVARANPFYRFVETIVHHGVTGGCAANAYCPGAATSREQMAVFVLVAKEGVGDAPPRCSTPMFGDVPASSPFCPWVEELARRGIAGGCGGGNYCPTDTVTREQMAVLALATKEPGFVPPACGAPVFADVPASSAFCPWIEELARRGVVAGCGGGNYCPAAPVARDAMATFISATFGLLLYGP